MYVHILIDESNNILSKFHPTCHGAHIPNEVTPLPTIGLSKRDHDLTNPDLELSIKVVKIIMRFDIEC